VCIQKETDALASQTQQNLRTSTFSVAAALDYSTLHHLRGRKLKEQASRTYARLDTCSSVLFQPLRAWKLEERISETYVRLQRLLGCAL
jgi:hypothetical protein